MNIGFITDINQKLKGPLNYNRADGFIIKILWWHLGVFVLVTFFPSPIAWRVISMPEAIVATFIAVVATLVPYLLKGTQKNYLPMIYEA